MYSMNNIQLKIGTICTVSYADSELVLGPHFIITSMIKLICFFCRGDKQEKLFFFLASEDMLY